MLLPDPAPYTPRYAPLVVALPHPAGVHGPTVNNLRYGFLDTVTHRPLAVLYHEYPGPRPSPADIAATPSEAVYRQSASCYRQWPAVRPDSAGTLLTGVYVSDDRDTLAAPHAHPVFGIPMPIAPSFAWPAVCDWTPPGADAPVRTTVGHVEAARNSLTLQALLDLCGQLDQDHEQRAGLSLPPAAHVATAYGAVRCAYGRLRAAVTALHLDGDTTPPEPGEMAAQIAALLSRPPTPPCRGE